MKMTAEGTSTINKLVELFLMSRSKGESACLSMESKDGKDSLTFSINNPSGSPAGQTGCWTPPGTRSPWTWPPPPRPWPQLLRRKKNPSQLKRDQKRKQDFLAKKSASAEVKEEVAPKNVEAEKASGKATIIDPVDEISLEEITVSNQEEVLIPQLDGVLESESQKQENREVFSFKSDIDEEVIENYLEEIFMNTNVSSAKIILKDQLRLPDYLYTLELKIENEKYRREAFSWPKMSSSQKDVFKNLKRIF